MLELLDDLSVDCFLSCGLRDVSGESPLLGSAEKGSPLRRVVSCPYVGRSKMTGLSDRGGAGRC